MPKTLSNYLSDSATTKKANGNLLFPYLHNAYSTGYTTPLEEYKQLKTLTQDMNVSIGVNYKIDKIFNIDLRYRYEQQAGENKTLSDGQSYIAGDLINAYSQINSITGAITYKIPSGGTLDEVFCSLSAQV